MDTVLIKRLFSAIHTGKSGDVEALCRRIISEERKLGHPHVAEDLERILASKRNGMTEVSRNGPSALTPLPVSKPASTIIRLPPTFHAREIG